MERLRGESLADTIKHGPVDQGWLRRLLGEVLSALEAAHGAGIIHRDIKPGNILLGPDGRAKVADFGIARVVEQSEADETAAALTGVGLVVGTPAYLAPERAMGHPATPRSDLYSLGVVIYEALTGRKPFTADTPAGVALAAAQRSAEDPLRLRPDADPDLVAVIARAMDPDPARRYASAADMSRDLRRPAAGTTAVMPMSSTLGPESASERAVVPVAERPPPPPAPSATLPPEGATAPLRRPWWGIAVAAAVVVIVIAFVLLARHESSGSRSAATATSVTVAPTTATTTAPVDTTPPTTAASPSSIAGAPSPAPGPVGAALVAIARHVAGSSSAAAAQLASGLQQVASISNPASQASAASALLTQVEQWYQQGQLSYGDAVLAAGVLHEAGAPQVQLTPRTGNGNG